MEQLTKKDSLPQQNEVQKVEVRRVKRPRNSSYYGWNQKRPIAIIFSVKA